MHEETIDYDPAIAEYHIKRGVYVTRTETVPEQVSQDAELYLCKNLCPFKDVCHFEQPVSTHCRRCTHMDCESMRCRKGRNDVEIEKGCELFELPVDNSESFFNFPE